MRTLIDGFNKLLDSMVNDLNNGRWFYLFAKYVAIGAMFAIAVLISIMIYHNISYIILAILGFFCVVAFWRHFFPPKPQQQTEMPVDNNTMVYNPAFLEDTYSMLLTNICPIIMEKADIMEIQKPHATFECEFPIHYTVKGFVLFHILLNKIDENVDIQRISEILQNTISQKLNNNEIIGISQSYYLYNGRALPAIMIDGAYNLGNCIRVDVVITCDIYCQYIMKRLQSRISNTSVNKPRDRDF